MLVAWELVSPVPLLMPLVYLWDQVWLSPYVLPVDRYPAYTSTWQLHEALRAARASGVFFFCSCHPLSTTGGHHDYLVGGSRASGPFR